MNLIPQVKELGAVEERSGFRRKVRFPKRRQCGWHFLLRAAHKHPALFLHQQRGAFRRRKIPQNSLFSLFFWDLKGYQPKPEVLKEELRLLASYKINSILLEIEDKYDYRCAPGVGVRGAYTFEEMREISRYAKSMNIMIVPKLQSLAHVDYLLKHARYAKLREDGHPFQYCASNPSAQKLWESMADELMECFAEHKEYFHIGADETDLLGQHIPVRFLSRFSSTHPDSTPGFPAVAGLPPSYHSRQNRWLPIRAFPRSGIRGGKETHC